MLSSGFSSSPSFRETKTFLHKHASCNRIGSNVSNNDNFESPQSMNFLSKIAFAALDTAQNVSDPHKNFFSDVNYFPCFVHIISSKVSMDIFVSFELPVFKHLQKLCSKIFGAKPFNDLTLFCLSSHQL